jgi:hypothetical protein
LGLSFLSEVEKPLEFRPFLVRSPWPANPVGITFGPDGNLYVADNTNNAVNRYVGPKNGGGGKNPGDPLPSAGNTGALFVAKGAGSLSAPQGLTFGSDKNLYVSSLASDSNPVAVKEFNGTTGAFIKDFATGGRPALAKPEGLIFGADTNLYVADFLNNGVQQFNGTTGAWIKLFASAGGLSKPVGITFGFGTDHNFYVASSGNNEVLQYNGTTGAFIKIFASGGGLNSPQYLVWH